MLEQKNSHPFVSIIIVLGICAALFMGARAFFSPLNFAFLFIAIGAVALRSKSKHQLTELKSHIVGTNSLIFLAFLLYGGFSASIIAAADAAISTALYTNNRLKIAFNTALAIVSTFVPAILIKQMIYPNIIDELHAGNNSNLFIALGIITIVQFFITSTSLAYFESLESDTPFFTIWKTSNRWTPITYAVGATIAGLSAVMVDKLGFQILLAGIPIFVFVYLANRMYLKNLEMSYAQAQKSAEYATLLEEKSWELRESEERFRSAFNHAPIGIAIITRDAKCQKVNKSLCKMLGYSEAEFCEKNLETFIHPEDLDETRDIFDCLASNSIPAFQKEHRFINKKNQTVWVSWSGSSISPELGEQSNLIFQFQDISVKKLVEEKLVYEATHDTLTGLTNRGYFIERLSLAISTYKKEPHENEYWVLFIDLDRFKMINDNFGHTIGDQLLDEISKRFKKCLRKGDLLARLSGDEFTVLVEKGSDEDDLVAIANRIEKQLKKPFKLKEIEVFISASIGIVKGTEFHNTAEEILRDADIAMYHAKSLGRSRFEIFDEKIHDGIKESFKFESELRNALNRQELTVFYQPIYSIESGKVEEFEALARWKHKTLGWISPEKFIPIAERSGLIHTLSKQVLWRACLDGIKLRNVAEDRDNFKISVNLSSSQFSQADLVESILNTINETNFDPSHIKLEITESALFESSETTSKMLHRLRDMGIQISIDDFGTGYSNLSSLSQIPISTLKIDKSFISPKVSRIENVTIVQTIMTLAHGLGLRVVAEGVETEQQLNYLKSLNCHAAQGFLIGKPMPFAEAKEFLKQQRLRTPLFSEEFTSISQISTLQ